MGEMLLVVAQRTQQHSAQYDQNFFQNSETCEKTLVWKKGKKNAIWQLKHELSILEKLLVSVEQLWMNPLSIDPLTITFTFVALLLPQRRINRLCRRRTTFEKIMHAKLAWWVCKNEYLDTFIQIGNGTSIDQ